MDDDLKLLNEAMVLKDRLRMLAELQASYWQSLVDQGFDQGTAEQLVLDWSRHAYDMTLRSLPTTQSIDRELDELLAGEDASRTPQVDEPAQDDVAGRGTSFDGSQTSASVRHLSDPSRVPPGEPWLQLAPELDECDEPGQQAA